MEKEGIVSIWGGKFASAADLYEFLEEVYDEQDDAESPFSLYIGTDYVEVDKLESAFFENTITAPDLKGFSYGESFISQLNPAQFSRCNAVILYFDYEHQPDAKDTNPLKFVGSYAYSLS